MSGRGRGKQLTRPAWMHQPRHPPPSLPRNQTSPAQVSDWAKAHAADGRPYWYSLSTGRTTWNDPAPGPSNPAPIPSPAPEPDTATATLWKQHRTDDGRVYYYNTLTNQTQWNPPAELSGPTSPTRPAAPSAVPRPAPASPPKTQLRAASAPTPQLPDGWAEHRTQDGRVYYYHAVTRQTRWDKPTSPTPQQSSAQPPQTHPQKRPITAVTPEADTSASTALPPNWAEHRTPDGKPYYYNKITRDTSWTKPSAQPDSKRPRTTAPQDLRNLVNRARQQRDRHSQRNDPNPRVVRRPRSSDGKPLTDRQSETYFLKRSAIRKQSASSLASPDKAGLHAMDVPDAVEDRETLFCEVLKEKGLTEKSTWLEAMSRCAGDPRYALVKPYGQRKHTWLKYCQKAAKERRRKDILKTRKAAEDLHALMDEVFVNEPYSVLTMTRCHPESVRAFENDKRYSVIDERQRPALIKSFFSARARKGALERARQRKAGMDMMRKALDDKIHPSLLAKSEKPNGHSQKEAAGMSRPVKEEPMEEDKSSIAPKQETSEDANTFYNDRTSFQELEQFLDSLPCSKNVDREDVSEVIRNWRRHVDVLVEDKRIREREARRALQRENRASFRTGVEHMLLNGKLPITARWKEVSDVVAKEDFAKPEADLGSRPLDLFEDGVRRFEDRVQRHRDEFKRLVKEGKIEITDTTTVEELNSKEPLTEFLKPLQASVVSALLLDRQRKENKRRQKEKDRAIAEFEEFIRRSETPVGTAYEVSAASWKDLPLYKQLLSIIGDDGVKRIYNDFMTWRKGKEERRMKRKFEMHHQEMPLNPMEVGALDGVKRAPMPMMHPEPIPFPTAQPREEENGWAAAVSAKPVTEAEKLEERKRRKRELLEGV